MRKGKGRARKRALPERLQKIYRPKLVFARELQNVFKRANKKVTRVIKIEEARLRAKGLKG